MRQEKGRNFIDYWQARISHVRSEVVLRVVELDAAVPLREKCREVSIAHRSGKHTRAGKTS